MDEHKVDAILGPGTSPLTEPVANVSERHGMPMVGSAAVTSIYKKGRKFVFGVSSPAERYLEGLIDMAATRGLKTGSLIRRARTRLGSRRVPR